jgi:flotillin
MADFLLELDVFANTAKLEAGLKKAEQVVDRTAGEMDKGVKVAEKGFGDLLSAITKVAGGLFLLEGAFKAGTAAASAMAGDTEAAANALRSLPLIGPLVTSVFDFANALEFAGAAARKARIETAGLAVELSRANRELTSAERFAAIYAEMDALKGLSESQILLNKNKMLYRSLDEKLLIGQRKINEEFDRQVEAQKEASINEAVRVQNIALINRERKIALMQEEALIEKERELLHLQVQRAREKEAEAAAAEAEAKRQEEFKKAEEERLRLIKEREQFERDLRESILKKEKEIAEEREKQRQAELSFVNARLKMEQEIAEARADAERQAAGATATFATAGGSFTAAASAQVNEAKLLTKISQQSRDFLAMIVQNTARMAGGLSLG